MAKDRETFVKHLQALVRIPTVSTPDPAQMRHAEFARFREILEETYPLLHKTLKKEILGEGALLYTWEGTGSGKKPLMLTAHQDVVPEGDLSAWKYPPYEAHLDEDGILWGRGTTDSKCNIEAYMDAIEGLIEDGFTPAYDLYLAFGYNEEIMGGPGAAGQILHDELKARGIDFGLVLDECGGITRREDGRYIAEIFVGEKGYADHEFYVDDPGGHSAYPPLHTAVGRLGKAVYELEENRMAPQLCPPVIQEMKCRAPFAEDIYRDLYADPEGNEKKLLALAETDNNFNQMLRTTTAPTMSAGSAQANILPEHASVITNSRILPGQTIEELEAHFRKAIPDEVHFRLIKGHNPPAVSSAQSRGYRLIGSILDEMYPGITMIPCIMAGGTDSRYYADLSSERAVYRFTGLLSSPRTGGAHSVNEHIDTEILMANVDFYRQLILRYGLE